MATMAIMMDRRDAVLGLSCFAAGLGAAQLLRQLWRYQPPAVWESVSSGGKWASINRPTAGPREEKALPRGEHALQLYSMGTPNGVKVTVLLEELCLKYGLEYDAYTISISGDQFGSEFVDINPNSKIPALLHHQVRRRRKQLLLSFGSHFKLRRTMTTLPRQARDKRKRKALKKRRLVSRRRARAKGRRRFASSRAR